ncbi:MAG TPA: molybdopterin cofactor-binding domain-containing protein, partial [Candidatus Acidoferrales bacterium]
MSRATDKAIPTGAPSLAFSEVSNAPIRKASRREFLKLGAVSGASLLLGFRLGDVAKAVAAGVPEAAGKDFAPNAFVEINPGGEVRLWAARSEMGQGVRTALVMILADELDADWAQVKVVQADFDAKYGDMTTGGSMSVRSSWDPLRKAGAAARAMLIGAAA